MAPVRRWIEATLESQQVLTEYTTQCFADIFAMIQAASFRVFSMFVRPATPRVRYRSRTGTQKAKFWKPINPSMHAGHYQRKKHYA
jgi:hypothetical protein